nr:MAG TPA: hypothetical protein [Microviridae sp.]
MICLILLMMLSCQSTNYYEIAGMKNELFTKREGTVVNDFINSRAIDRAFDINNEEQQEQQEKQKEVRNMDGDFSNLITTITSAMAGIYVAIKTIIAFVKKLKKK